MCMPAMTGACKLLIVTSCEDSQEVALKMHWQFTLSLLGQPISEAAHGASGTNPAHCVYGERGIRAATGSGAA